jgi:hypothetical protein
MGYTSWTFSLKFLCKFLTVTEESSSMKSPQLPTDIYQNSIIAKPSAPISTSTLPTRPLPSTILSSTSVSTPYTRLQASLLFAQEYAILGASLEDRPFVPPCTVVFLSGSGGPNDLNIVPVPAPEGIRRAFRKWEDGIGARTVMMLPVEKVLEAVGVGRGM